MRQQNIFVFMLVISGLLGTAGVVFAQQVPPVTYQQEHLMLTDEQGDHILWRLFLDTCETGVKKVVVRRNLAPQSSQLRRPRFAEANPILEAAADKPVDNRQAKPLFDAKTTLQNLKRLIREEQQKGYAVSIGQKHTWKVRFTGLSKIVVALATASSARFLYVGQEIPLIDWIKTCPDQSVTIEQLFHQSYSLNKGNVYLTILTIENVLSDATFEVNRENTLVNRKLADLYADSPNKFGDWYHFFGTMLAGYVKESASTIAQVYSVYRKISRGKLAEKSTMAADKEGAKMGENLRHFVEMEEKGRFRILLKDLQVSLATASVQTSSRIQP